VPTSLGIGKAGKKKDRRTFVGSGQSPIKFVKFVVGATQVDGLWGRGALQEGWAYWTRWGGYIGHGGDTIGVRARAGNRGRSLGNPVKGIRKSANSD